MQKLSIDNLTAEAQRLLQLPPKVLQFGTGVLLRGLPDYYIDKANRSGVFNGRIVVVKSTDKGNTDAFDSQNGLYTHWLRGFSNGETVDEVYINTAIYAVHSAAQEWEMILKYAEMPSMELIISNTTEAGIRMQDDQVHAAPPKTFPGKLLSFLFHRYRTFSGDPKRGMVIVPTELITDNGQLLLAVLVELAHQHGFDSAFIDWLENANDFCNSLVDRIVPGSIAPPAVPDPGYEDALMIMSEPYGLWAIESSSDRVRKVLSFASQDPGVVITPNITQFRERKLRLLNGVHTFSCGIALLAKHAFVVDSMQELWMVDYMSQLMKADIAPLLSQVGVKREDAHSFADQVLDRFRNPFLKHPWINIAAQFTPKMNMRNLPLLLESARIHGRIPDTMALGFAAYVLSVPLFATVYPEDPAVVHWQQEGDEFVLSLLKDHTIWGQDLSQHAVLVEGIVAAIARIKALGIEQAALQTIHQIQSSDVS
jgi:tagaturonate reductase